MRKLRIIDVTLRDGMHAVSHQFTPDDMAEIAAALDQSQVSTIEMGHGDGLGGSSFQYGFSAATDEDYLKAVAGVLKNAKLDVLLLPGIGTHKDLEKAAALGAKMVRVATHVTEADVSAQHIKIAKSLGLETVGFLMMSHMAEPEVIVSQVKLFEDYGADMVYLADSAGAMLPFEVTAKIKAVKNAVRLPVGFHAHNNLGLAMGNSLAAIEAGADSVDGSLRGLGAGAGNTQTEVLAAVCDRLNIETGVDLYRLMDTAEEVLAPKMRRPQIINRASLTLGWAGVYSSFLLHAQKASETTGVEVREILVELGRRKTVGGQEDLIIDVAHELGRKKPMRPEA